MSLIISTTPSLFKRLILPKSCGKNADHFFLKKMADSQIKTPGNFTTDPLMTVIVDDEEGYKFHSILQNLNYTMKHFMRPYNIAAFGNISDISSKFLLTRAWLQHVDGKNNVIVIFEKFDSKREVNEYTNLLDYKTVWNSKFSDCQEADAIQQTLTNDFDTGYWCTNIELK